MEVRQMDTEIAIVGAGLAGLGMGAILMKKGIKNFVILEKAEAPGGTWRDNTYPGCQCDVPSHMYSFSFYPNPNWSRAFALQAEIYNYIEDFTQHFKLREKIKYNTEVTRALWDKRLRCWKLEIKNSNELRVKFLISAIGPLSYPQVPDFAGLESFKGATMHSATWDASVNLEGKSVAVIGTGASSIQIVPSIADKVAKLYVFQRTPAWILPRADRKYTAIDKLLFKYLPGYQRLVRWMMYFSREALVPSLTKHPERLKLLEFLAWQHLKARIKDPVLREKLKPTFTIGCKRILLSNEYYPALTKPNVTLVTDPISHFYSEGVELKDGQKINLDAVIFATGFKVTDHPGFAQIFNAQGLSLAEIWGKEGMSAYYGTMIPKFPNLFTILGPNTGLGHNSMIFMMEAQYNLITDVIKTVSRLEKSTAEPDESVVKLHNQELQKRLRRSVWVSGCASWYLDQKGNVPTMWPGFTWEFWFKTRRVNLRDLVIS
jgi:cation diffusion facilitator CzcD-associated flavoprotein CzcO